MPRKKKEEVKRKTNVKRVLSIIILFLGTFGLTLSFAELADSVQRRGSYAYSNSHAKWDIGIANISKADLKGDAKVVNELTTNNLGLTEYVVTFTHPGDSVKYTFELKNNGDIDAKLVEFNKGNPTCKAASVVQDVRDDETKNADSTLVCGNVAYTVTYEDGKEVKQNDIISAKSTKKVVLTVTYKEGSKEAIGPVDVTVPELTLLFK